MVMSSKAGTSKRVGEDITKQAKKIKAIDVRLSLSAAAAAVINRLAFAQPASYNLLLHRRFCGWSRS
jgi:hypothetical protein